MVERKMYLKTRSVAHDPRLRSLMDRSPLENAVTEAHSTELCDGGDDCPVTRGEGACYGASTLVQRLSARRFFCADGCPATNVWQTIRGGPSSYCKLGL